MMVGLLESTMQGGVPWDPCMELVHSRVSCQEGPRQFDVQCSMMEVQSLDGLILTRLTDFGGPCEVYRLRLITGSEGPKIWIQCFKEENPWKKTFPLESLIQNPLIPAELMVRFPHAIPRLIAWLYRLGREQDATAVARTILNAIDQSVEPDPA